MRLHAATQPLETPPALHTPTVLATTLFQIAVVPLITIPFAAIKPLDQYVIPSLKLMTGKQMNSTAHAVMLAAFSMAAWVTTNATE
jgi:hypothetical protein